MPREMGKVRAAAHAAVVQAWERVSGARGDEGVDGVAGGDGGEPDAQPDVLVQRVEGVQVGLFEGAGQRGGGQDGQQPGLAGAAAGDGAGEDGAGGQDQDHAGPGPGVGQD